MLTAKNANTMPSGHHVYFLIKALMTPAITPAIILPIFDFGVVLKSVAMYTAEKIIDPVIVLYNGGLPSKNDVIKNVPTNTSGQRQSRTPLFHRNKPIRIEINGRASAGEPCIYVYMLSAELAIVPLIISNSGNVISSYLKTVRGVAVVIESMTTPGFVQFCIASGKANIKNSRATNIGFNLKACLSIINLQNNRASVKAVKTATGGIFEGILKTSNPVVIPALRVGIFTFPSLRKEYTVCKINAKAIYKK